MFDIDKHGMAKLYRSRFSHFTEKNDITCAYHSLKITTEYFSSDMMGFIQNCIRFTPTEALSQVSTEKRHECLELLNRLCNNGIFIPVSDLDTISIEAVRRAVSKGPNIRVMVLHLTDYCNLKCKYCFIEGNIKDDYKRKNMTIEVIKNLLISLQK